MKKGGGKIYSVFFKYTCIETKSTNLELKDKLTDLVAEHRESEILEDVEDVHHDLLQAAVDVDPSVLDVLDVRDERVDVSLGLLDLRLGQAQGRSQRVQQRLQQALQLGQQTVQVGRRLVRCRQTRMTSMVLRLE